MARYDNNGGLLDLPIIVSRATGRVAFGNIFTSSAQPAFYALAVADQPVANGSTLITFGGISYNRGSGFTGSRFTAPVPGVYLFFACIEVFGGTPNVGNVGISLRVNGNSVFVKYDSKLSTFNGAMIAVPVALSANDYVEIYGEMDALSGSPVVQNTRSYFSGALLY